MFDMLGSMSREVHSLFVWLEHPIRPKSASMDQEWNTEFWQCISRDSFAIPEGLEPDSLFPAYGLTVGEFSTAYIINTAQRK